MRTIIVLLIALLGLATVSAISSSAAVAAYDEADVEAEDAMDVEDVVEDEAEAEDEDEVDVEDEDEVEDEAEDEVDMESESAEEIDAEGEALFDAIEAALVEAEAESDSSKPKAPTPAKCSEVCKNRKGDDKKRCMNQCENPGAAVPVQNNADCASTCAKKSPAAKPKCLTDCEARKGRKRQNDSKNGCGACNDKACCAAKPRGGCEWNSSLNFCVEKSATDKKLVRKELEARAKGLIPGLLQKAREAAKSYLIGKKEKVITDAINKFTANDNLRLNWRTLGDYEKKQGVVSALMQNIPKMLGSALGSYVGGKIGGVAGELLGPIVAKIAGAMPFRNEIQGWLIKKAVGMLGLEAQSEAGIDKLIGGEKVRALVEKAVTAKWAEIEKRISNPTKF